MTTVLNYGGGLEKYFIDTAASLSSQGIEVDLITMDERFTEKILKIISILFFKNHMKDIEARITDDYINKNIGKANYYKFQKISNLRKSLKKYDIVYSKNELLEAFILKYFICYGCIPKVVFCCATAINYPMPVTFIDKTHNALYSGSVYKSLCNGVAAYHVKNNDDKVRYSKMFPQKNIYYIPNAINNSFADFGLSNRLKTKISYG